MPKEFAGLQATDIRKGDRIFLLGLSLFSIVLTVNLFVQFTWIADSSTQPYLTGVDPNGYYAYAHSLLFDQDLNFRNEYKFLAETQPLATAEPFRGFLEKEPANPVNQFNIGTAIAALPLLTFTRLLVGIASAGRIIHPVSSFASIYPFVFCLNNLWLGMASLLFSYVFLRRWFAPSPAALGCSCVALCGPMLYYLWAEPGMSHLTGAFFSAAALLCWSRWTATSYIPRRVALAFACGFCAALAAIVRPYDAPIAIVLAQPLLSAVATKQHWRSQLAATIAAMIGALLGSLPQLLAWHIQFGHWIANPTDHEFPWNSPWALHVLFSRRHGLFFWSPALLISVVTLALYIRRSAFPAAWLFAIFAGVTWMAGTWWCYWLGVSFGLRSYVDHPLPFAFGFAAAAAWIIQELPTSGRNITWELLLLFTMINMHLIICFQGGVIWVDGPLYWLQTISDGKKYKAQLRREAVYWTDFTPSHRANLLEAPAGYK